jgi:hypothetical protein
MDSLSRFDELRIKTDNELLQILSNELNAGLGAAFVALRSLDPVSAEGGYRKAQHAYDDVSRLLPVAPTNTEHERHSLNAKLYRLRKMLEALSVPLDGNRHAQVLSRESRSESAAGEVCCWPVGA